MSKGFWHLVLGLAGCVPGPVGIVSNVLDALIYAFGDHDYWMTAWCLLSAGSLGCGSVIKIATQGGRLSQTAMKGMMAFNLMSNTISFAKGASNFSETCYQIYQKYTVEGRPVSFMGILEDGRNLTYSIATCILSGIGIRDNTKGLVKSGSSSKTVYRGDRASVVPEDVFQNGFSPKGTHNYALLHTKSNATAGSFVSTSVDMSIATDFGGKNGYVYVIQTDNYVDINATYGAGVYFPERIEFSILGGIKPSEIVGAYKKRKRLISGWIPSSPRFSYNDW